MKNLLKKLSGADRNDRREALEHDAAEKIKEVGGKPPAEVTSASWVNPVPATDAPATGAPVTDAPVTDAPAGRRLTVQERMAARQLQNQ